MQRNPVPSCRGFEFSCTHKLKIYRSCVRRAHERRKIGLELLGARVLTLTAEVRDLQYRFTAMEHRFAALESRFTAMESRLSGIESRLSGIEGRLGVTEERMSAMLALIVRIAERLDGGSQ